MARFRTKCTFKLNKGLEETSGRYLDRFLPAASQ